ncbi:MAG TPA: cation diffusion facilitator family transporter [Candidatus Dormibacteraeota bacterium]|nr:cation diffusion facilitator family transporter [Candidatus Dormibacteraeota bacterium]
MSTGHDHTHDLTGGRLRLAFGLTLIILATELVAGLVSHSLALLSDAGHILTDAMALGLAWFAVAQGRRPADSRRTYGYQRVGILAALVNSATLIVIVAAIALGAVQRLRHPEPVQGAIVIAAALVAIAVNAFIGLSLRGAGGDLNVRAAMLHVLGDLAASVGVVVAGAVILLTGWLPADPLLSLGIAALIAFGAWGIVRRTVHILLEGTPTGLDLAAVRAEMEAYDGVESVHDLHVWSLSSEAPVLSGHIVVSDELMADAEHRMRGLKERLDRRFGIRHTTIQLESCHPCPGDCEELTAPSS